ncbi:hypothetical protein I5Q34_26515 [Streptomyces sp. AV19]|uniref:DUF5954 family protein n=1 Tax=Streptomyces sp. AV19 TaxID=2793068 RepID=UPI0018FECAE1|nr:DUF5954 family protein [Streptomyces sp. AV19]MBH1937783.1 hypothetical protein [Streptomyces sp. AV19]MDG4537059.1 DUF5954 family protein [Streptomyces sp. AV19]
MGHGESSPGGMRPVIVRYPEGPVEAVAEADALDAALDMNAVLVRGPLFGVAAQDAGEAPRWRVVVGVQAGCPQQARDSLNSLLWFRAKDEAKSAAERRALLTAVAQLESERVDELTVLGTRYRVVRAEEYAGLGPDGIEQPRPTDPEPAVPNWDRGKREARIDDGLVLDPEAPVTPAQAAERLALRDLDYAGDRFPEDVRQDSRQALTTHPDVLLLPTVFRVVEQDGPGWKTGSGAHAYAHDARKSLDFALTWFEPRRRGLIPWDADDRAVDARAVSAEGTDPAATELAEYAQAADRLRSERTNRIEAGGTAYQICRARRLLRWGPDGPERPRPSDTNSHPPAPLHPHLDEDGNVHYDHDNDQA